MLSLVENQSSPSDPLMDIRYTSKVTTSDYITLSAREWQQEQDGIQKIIDSTFEGRAGVREMFRDIDEEHFEPSKNPSATESKYVEIQMTKQKSPIENNLCAGTGSIPVRYYEFILDNGSQVSVSHPRFLT